MICPRSYTAIWGQTKPRGALFLSHFTIHRLLLINPGSREDKELPHHFTDGKTEAEKSKRILPEVRQPGSVCSDSRPHLLSLGVGLIPEAEPAWVAMVTAFSLQHSESQLPGCSRG